LTERWEKRLRDLHVEASPEMWRRVQEGSRNQPPLGLPPRRRLVAAVVALAVFAGAGVFAWRAFGPTSPAVSSATPTPSSGLRVYTDPLGWTASYPADSLVFTTGRTSDGLATAVTFVNRVAALQQGPTQNYVMLRITHALNATADPSAGSSAFPLSASDFKPVPGPVDFSLLDFTIDGVRYSATLRVGASASKADIAAMDALIASIRPSASTSSAIVRSDGRTFRCTVTFPQVPLTPGAPTGAIFSVQNVTGKAEQVRVGINGDVGWLVFASDGTRLQDSSRTHDGIAGPAPQNHVLAPEHTMKIGSEDTAVLWPGPLQITPSCMGKALPAVRLPVASPGAPATTTAALDQAVTAFGSKFDSCRPRQSGVWVTGIISGTSGKFDARCAALVIAYPGFDVVVLATVAPPDAPSVDLGQLADMIEAVPVFSFPNGSTIRLFWWVTVVTASATSCSRAAFVSISPDSSSYSSGPKCEAPTIPGG